MKSIVVLLVSGVFLISCKAQQVSITNTEWKLIKLERDDVSSLNPLITLSFDENQKKISGFGGCNSFFGSYTSENSTITISALGSTKRFCQDNQNVEDQYFKILGTVQSFRIEGKKLLLLAGNQVILEFSK